MESLTGRPPDGRAAAVQRAGESMRPTMRSASWPSLQTERAHPPIEDFTTQNLDIYVAPGDDGLWLSALRDPAAGIFTAVSDAFKAGEPLMINLLYGDFEDGQRVITQMTLRHVGDDRWLAQATRHFDVDRPEPQRQPSSTLP